jgi:hypothetical protein
MIGKTFVDLMRPCSVRPANTAAAPRLWERERQATSRRPQRVGIPYTTAALRQSLLRLEQIWEVCQGSRKRSAIYSYLAAVLDLHAEWSAEGKAFQRSRRVLRVRGLEIWEREDPLAAIIRATAAADVADKRVRSKWVRALRYAESRGASGRSVQRVIEGKGGINACAALAAKMRIGFHAECMGDDR